MDTLHRGIWYAYSFADYGVTDVAVEQLNGAERQTLTRKLLKAQSNGLQSFGLL